MSDLNVPVEAVDWIRGVFSAANASVAKMMAVNPHHHEPELDMALIGALNHFPPVSHPGGWTVYIQTHFLGGRRHFYNWEVADIGLLVIFRAQGEVRRVKVGLLQSKRLYATEEKALPDHPNAFRVGFGRLLSTKDAFLDLVAGRTFSFTPDSKYLALEVGSDQSRVLDQYQKMSRIPVYYLLYNPPQIPLIASVPATSPPSFSEISVGCRVLPVDSLSAHLHGKSLGYSPCYSDTTTIGSRFVGQHAGGWRLEHFVADLLLGCKEGHVTTAESDQVLEGLFYRRSGPIAAAIAVTIDAPPGVDLSFPDGD